jgi:hypothetical protein
MLLHYFICVECIGLNSNFVRIQLDLFDFSGSLEKEKIEETSPQALGLAQPSSPFPLFSPFPGPNSPRGPILLSLSFPRTGHARPTSFLSASPSEPLPLSDLATPRVRPLPFLAPSPVFPPRRPAALPLPLVPLCRTPRCPLDPLLRTAPRLEASRSYPSSDEARAATARGMRGTSWIGGPHAEAAGPSLFLSVAPSGRPKP